MHIFLYYIQISIFCSSSSLVNGHNSPRHAIKMFICFYCYKCFARLFFRVLRPFRHTFWTVCANRVIDNIFIVHINIIATSQLISTQRHYLPMETTTTRQQTIRLTCSKENVDNVIGRQKKIQVEDVQLKFRFKDDGTPNIMQYNTVQRLWDSSGQLSLNVWSKLCLVTRSPQNIKYLF